MKLMETEAHCDSWKHLGDQDALVWERNDKGGRRGYCGCRDGGESGGEYRFLSNRLRRKRDVS